LARTRPGSLSRYCASSGFGEVNEVYGSFFTGDYPARACYQVARLPKDALVEIEAVAVK